MIEDMLDKAAEKILSLDEASLTALWDKYKVRIERVDRSREWERAVIIFFIINAVRAKNHLFNEYVLQEQRERRENKSGNKPGKKSPPNLRIIK
ncbi:MAG: hypothetical protein LBV07_01845 [Syntrophobacterales bacterium]|nr:hypothetical protein [Syntrophobacterales bacterium]